MWTFYSAGSIEKANYCEHSVPNKQLRWAWRSPLQTQQPITALLTSPSKSSSWMMQAYNLLYKERCKIFINSRLQLSHSFRFFFFTDWSEVIFYLKKKPFWLSFLSQMMLQNEWNESEMRRCSSWHSLTVLETGTDLLSENLFCCTSRVEATQNVQFVSGNFSSKIFCSPLKTVLTHLLIQL